MTKRNDGGPAFPPVRCEYNTSGMSLRDWYAGQALAGMAGSWGSDEGPLMTETAYALADAMLTERDRT